MFQTNPFRFLRAEETTPSPSSRRKRKHKKTENNSPHCHPPLSKMSRSNIRFGFLTLLDLSSSPDILPSKTWNDYPQLNLSHDFNGDVEVSPAKIACTYTEINVQANMLGLIAHIKAELQAEFDQRIEMKIQPLAVRTTRLET